MKILLLGKNGQVGWELQRSLAPLGELIALDRQTVDGLCGDLADLSALRDTIARLKPDLIVADLNRHQALYSDLASIAPTLLLPSRGEDYEGSLKSAELIGKALGKSPQMEVRIAQNRENLKNIAQQIPAGEHEALLVGCRKAGKPAGVGRRADHDEQCAGVDPLLGIAGLQRDRGDRHGDRQLQVGADFHDWVAVLPA